MKEMTNRELTDKISQVFADFEDPAADYGWRELRKKYPENDKKILPLWWGTAAAIVMLVCGLWYVNQDTDEVAIVVEKSKPMEQINKVHSDKQPENTSENRYSSGSAASYRFDSTGSVRKTKFSNYINLSDSTPSEHTFNHKHSTARSTFQLKSEQKEVLSLVAVQRLSIESNTQKIPVISFPEPVNSASAINWPETRRDSLIDVRGKMLALAQQKQEADVHPHHVKKTGYESKKISSENNSFSFYAGSYFNYSLGSETKLNFGAGFTSDIKLTNHLKFSTGLAVANNSLTYNNGVPSTSKEKLAFDALPSFGSSTSTGSVNNNLTTITKYDASLLALDIPINLKYLIIPKDNKLYLLAGLSSGTYLAETYSLDFRSYSPAGLYVSQTQGIEVKKQLKSFDIARILNISFGYSANLGKSQNITIEPFLKYPLSGLGSQDLKFGATGINLKMNFSQFNK